MTPSPLWTASAAATATTGRQTGDWSATGISIDTRSLESGDLFVALSGPNFDGHDFITGAFDSGAAAALVSDVGQNSLDDAGEFTTGTQQSCRQEVQTLFADASKRRNSRP